jgi:hypothetical protein
MKDDTPLLLFTLMAFQKRSSALPYLSSESLGKAISGVVESDDVYQNNNIINNLYE